MSPALTIENLRVSYGATVALTDVTMTVERGEMLGVIGPNGGGKSTLLKAVLGLAPVESGRIDVLGKPQKEGRGAVGYVPQFAKMDKRFPISVGEVVMTAAMKGKGIHPFFRYSKAHREKARQALERVGAAELFDRQISQLSGGQFQRMLIARALALDPELLLLDEPTASIDAESSAHIYQLLHGLAGQMTIVLVSHDLHAVAENATKVAQLNRTLRYFGPPTEGMMEWEVCRHG